MAEQKSSLSANADKEPVIEAAARKLQGFLKPASQIEDRHDPERWARWIEGRQHEPRIVTWAELGRRGMY